MTNRLLLEKVADPETLLAAWKRIRAKGAQGGIDGMTVEDFAADAEARLDELRRELLEERYVPDPLQQVAIPKGPGKSEKRILGLPTVRDKIVQEAVRSVIEPRLDKIFLDCSYGYRSGKGPQRAIARVNHYLTSMKRRWIVTADIDDFFGSLNQDRLIEQLRPVLQDEAVLRLIQLMLKMGTVDWKGRWHDVFSGVNQGSVISPVLANFYLHPFDQSMTAQGFGLVRYADDFVILCQERSEAERALVKATEFLKEQLSLRLNPNPRPITTLEDGFAFLGIYFQGDQRLIDADKLAKMAAKIKRFTTPPLSDDFARALREINEAIVGWRRYYGSIVATAELGKVEQLIRDGLIQLVAQAFRRGTFKTQADGEAALQGLELLIERGQQERREFITQMVRQGREARSASSPAEASGRLPSSVAAQVRRKKRAHQQQLAQISELVLNTPGCFLGKTDQRIVVRRERRKVYEAPLLRLTGITIASPGITLSADVIDQCAEHEIPILFLSPQGKVVAVLSAPESSNGAIGLLQMHALMEGKPAMDLAKRFAWGKIKNQMNLMKYFHKYRKHVDAEFAAAFRTKLAAMEKILGELKQVEFKGDLQAARGHLLSIEGRAASEYWDLVGLLLKGQTDFPGRERKGAKDLVNSLLNYGYALLQSRVYLAAIKAGLTPEISFLHALQKRKPTLVYDLMEEFRPQIVDRTVLKMLARREKLEVTSEGLLTDHTRRRLIQQIQQRLATLIRFRGREMKLEEVIQHQAQLLVKHLRGEAEYRAFVGKW
ncbi:MAG: CRISPR-associated endonuclease Cas1 [Candidatus Methanomethylicaceae archaeon]